MITFWLNYWKNRVKLTNYRDGKANIKLTRKNSEKLILKKNNNKQIKSASRMS